MKRNRDLDDWDGRRPEELRTTLRQWKVPGPPPELEDDLRQVFHRGRPRVRRRALGLALAASLVILLVTLGRPSIGPRPPAADPAAPVVNAPATAAVGPAEPAAVPPAAAPAMRPSTSRAIATGGGTPARRGARGEPVVVVEPGQAALLAELARSWQNARHALPAGPPPRIESETLGARPRAVLQAPSRDEVLRYHSEWKTVETEWPFVHWSL